MVARTEGPALGLDSPFGDAAWPERGRNASVEVERL
jgi:hypothetical protein